MQCWLQRNQVGTTDHILRQCLLRRSCCIRPLQRLHTVHKPPNQRALCIRLQHRKEKQQPLQEVVSGASKMLSAHSQGFSQQRSATQEEPLPIRHIKMYAEAKQDMSKPSRLSTTHKKFPSSSFLKCIGIISTPRVAMGNSAISALNIDRSSFIIMRRSGKKL